MKSSIQKKDYKIYPLIPLRDIVVFPKMIVPLFVGRDKSIKAIEQTENNKQQLVLVTQKDVNVDDPAAKDLYEVGVVCKIIQSLKLPDGTLKLLAEATAKVRVMKIIENNGYFQVVTEPITDVAHDDIDTKALMKSISSQFQEYAKYNLRLNHEIFNVLDDITDAGHLADIITSNLAIAVAKKQELLEINDVKAKLNKLLVEIEYEISLLKSEQQIRENVRKQMEKTQKDYFLNEQLKAIHKELGTTNKDGESEFSILEKKIKEVPLSAEAKEKAEAELHKLKATNAMSAEGTVIRNYLDCLLALPWGVETEVNRDITKAEAILNRDHYGLQKVKDRILEFLSVQNRTKAMKGPIICFVGPPGVGKTSLAKSIAEATGRNFVKFALGGVRDESEVRGHRKTYLGSMPGKILYLLKKAKSSNPVMLLDEIDKLGSDFRGDPAFALLEALDPEQNNKFVDHYLEVEFDLSKTIFIATANSTNMHRALLDRMEIIRVEGYTEDEKIEIAKSYLIKKQLEAHNLTTEEFSVSDEALIQLIRYYTSESGVRSLDRAIAKLARKVVREFEQSDKKSAHITPELLEKYLGVKKYTFGESEEKDQVGVTTGLAYTEVGGDLLSIEAVTIPGKGSINATGKLGKVMQESAQAAFTYFKSRYKDYGVPSSRFRNRDVHIHVPAGATPKEGPSAGIALFTSIVSAMTNIPVYKDIAMTGEITLRGRVLPIGGLKEKLLAASRGGIKRVLIPHENKKDLSEIPENITKKLEIICVKTVDEVLKHALTEMPLPIIKVEAKKIPQVLMETSAEGTITH